MNTWPDAALPTPFNPTHHHTQEQTTMFNFTPREAPTGKHHLDNHPNPVTVAELAARERTE